MRLIICLIVLSLTHGIYALETSLILRPPGGNGTLMAVVNPGIGSIQLYETQADKLIEKFGHNFLQDLQLIRDMPTNDNRNNWIRPGSPNNAPGYASFMNSFSERQGANKEKLAPRRRFENAEREFFDDLPEYDGIVRAAMTADSLMIVIPNMYTILAYTVIGKEVQLAGWHNYRHLLYLPEGFNTKPMPNDLYRKLPKDTQLEFEEMMEKRLEELGDDANLKFTAAPSEAWIVSHGSNRYVLLDVANKCLIYYQVEAGAAKPVTLGLTAAGRIKTLSVRNLEYELLIPTLYNSQPDDLALVKRFNQQLKRASMPEVNADILMLLSEKREIQNEDNSGLQANFDENGYLYLDFTKQNKLFVYKILSNNTQVEFIAARNYAIETGKTVYYTQLFNARRAASIVQGIDKRASSRAKDDEKNRHMRLLQMAVNLDPAIYKEIEKSRKITRALSEHENWTSMIEGAEQADEKNKTEWEQILEEAQARAAARAARRAKK